MTAPTAPTSKVVLITGASSGIGEATSRRLAADGHRLVLGARRTGLVAAVAKEIEADGGSAIAHELDVTSKESVRAFVQAAQDRYGRVDVLVNNAGVMPLSPLDALKVDEWDRMIDVNLKGVLYGIAAALPIFERQHSGQFINIASVAGLKVRATNAVYAATKHAVRALSEGLRQEAGEGIRTTIISPGAVQSELPLGSSDPESAAQVKDMYQRTAIAADAVARAIAYAIEQPADVDVNEIVLRPTVQEF